MGTSESCFIAIIDVLCFKICEIVVVYSLVVAWSMLAMVQLKHYGPNKTTLSTFFCQFRTYQQQVCTRCFLYKTTQSKYWNKRTESVQYMVLSVTVITKILVCGYRCLNVLNVSVTLAISRNPELPQINVYLLIIRAVTFNKKY